jgi:hypothetical protein
VLVHVFESKGDEDFENLFPAARKFMPRIGLQIGYRRKKVGEDARKAGNRTAEKTSIAETEGDGHSERDMFIPSVIC